MSRGQLFDSALGAGLSVCAGGVSGFSGGYRGPVCPQLPNNNRLIARVILAVMMVRRMVRIQQNKKMIIPFAGIGCEQSVLFD